MASLTPLARRLPAAAPARPHHRHSGPAAPDHAPDGHERGAPEAPEAGGKAAADPPSAAPAGRESSEAPGPASGRRLLFGTAALVGTNVFRLGLQFLMLPILARLLGPEAYGLVAFSMPIVFFATIFSEGGLTAALVREREGPGSERLESTVFWTSFGVGGALALLLVAAGGALGSWLGEPRLGPLIAGLSPVLLLSALCVVPFARLQRQGRLWVFAAGETTGLVGGVGVALYGAFNGWGAWSLVAQQVVLWAAKFGFALAFSGLRRVRAWAPRLLLGIAGFSGFLVGSRVVEFFSYYTDALLIGFLLGAQQVGYYTVAMQLSKVPELVMAGPLVITLLPAIAQARDDGARAVETYLAFFRIVAVAALPAAVGMAAVAEPLVAVVLGPKWATAGAVLAALAPVGLLRCLGPVSNTALVGLGRSDVQFRIMVATTALSVLGVAAGTAFGLVGVAAGLGLATLAGHARLHVRALRLLGLEPGVLLRQLRLPLLATAVMAVAVAALRFGVAWRSPAAELVACAAAGALVYGAALLALARKEILGDVRRLLRTRSASKPPSQVG